MKTIFKTLTILTIVGITFFSVISSANSKCVTCNGSEDDGVCDEVEGLFGTWKCTDSSGTSDCNKSDSNKSEPCTFSPDF